MKFFSSIVLNYSSYKNLKFKLNKKVDLRFKNIETNQNVLAFITIYKILSKEHIFNLPEKTIDIMLLNLSHAIKERAKELNQEKKQEEKIQEEHIAIPVLNRLTKENNYLNFYLTLYTPKDLQ